MNPKQDSQVNPVEPTADEVADRFGLYLKPLVPTLETALNAEVAAGADPMELVGMVSDGSCAQSDCGIVTRRVALRAVPLLREAAGDEGGAAIAQIEPIVALLETPQRGQLVVMGLFEETSSFAILRYLPTPSGGGLFHLKSVERTKA